jgi:arabinose-5-phosphate isomerase
MISNPETICQLGRNVIIKETKALQALSDRLDKNFASACKILLECRGRIIVMGMGKSGHIANKIAATLASTGSPAFFLHPAEASHGDLGNIVAGDVILALSGSGNTPEILAILPIIQHRKIAMITITGNPNSTLAQAATINLDASVEQEACPLGLAPTCSTTAALAVGDALAIALLEARGFTAKDFAHNHPGGVIGKRLLLLVDHVMRTGDNIPKVLPTTTIIQALLEISQKRMGMTTVIDAKGKLKGIYTDGDLRRSLDKNIDIHHTMIKDVMSPHCKTIKCGMLAMEALQIMEQFQITALVVVDENNAPVGALHIHDLLKEGVG